MKKNFQLKIARITSARRWFLITSILVGWLGWVVPTLAQEAFYYHTIHSHGLTTTFGRTVKINYLYQMGRVRQLKFSGLYVYDSYQQGRNHIKANLYNAQVQMQWHVYHRDNFFCNLAVGGGGYLLQAKDVLAVKFHEWRFNFVSGIELEFFIKRNVMAATVSYDFLYTPWSKIYDYLHVPTVGLTFFFF